MKYILEGISFKILIIGLLLLISLIILSPMMGTLILSLFLAYAIRPISLRLKKYTKYESFSIFMAVILVILPFIFLFIFSLSVIVNAIPSLIHMGQNFNIDDVDSTLFYCVDFINNYLPDKYHLSLELILDTIKNTSSSILNWILTYTINSAKSVPMISLHLMVLVMATYYFIKDGHNIIDFFNSVLSINKLEFFDDMSKETELVLRSIFYGHFLTAVIIGVLAGVGYFSLGYPYAIFLGILSGFLQLIPILGPWPVYLGLVVYDIVHADYMGAALVLLFGMVLSASDIYIRPKLSDKYANIHPLILFLGFLGGPILFGFIGFLLGPLILGVTYAALIAYKKDKNSRRVYVE